MALTPEERQLLKSIFRRLKDEPLQPDSEYYEPIYAQLERSDPVEQMFTYVDWAEVESVQMFSGFRGSGKTTELFRLRERLKEEGYIVLYADALEYINPADEIDITDLLIVLAGAFSDALEDELSIDLAGESYWTRFWNYLNKTDVEVTEVSVKSGVDLKMALKTTPSFRQRLQTFLSQRIFELKNQVDKFIEDGVKALRKKHGDDVRIVFLFDSLEQLRGSLFTQQAVIRSVERLFTEHQKMLQLPYLHMVYTVPPWLQFVRQNIGKIILLPSVRQWNNDAARTTYEPGWKMLRSSVHKRFGADGCQQVFGAPDAQGNHPLADQLIAVCGGHFRDLLKFFGELLTLTKTTPVTDEAIAATISSVRKQFLPIAIEDARWLHKIGQLRANVLINTDAENVGRLTKFLDTHLVLYLTNGEPWYDIHPLIRDEVADIVKQHGETAPDDKPST